MSLCFSVSWCCGRAILRLLLVRHEGQWHLLQEGSSCYHPEEEAQEEGREQTKQQGGVTQHQHPGQHPGPGPWTTTQRPWAGPGYAPSALQGPGAWNGLPPGPSMGWPPPHALPPHHPQHGFTPFPPSGPGIVHPSHPIPCPPAHPGSFHPFLRPPPLAPHGWPGHADGPWADRVAEGNTAWGTGDNPWSNMPGDNRRGEGSSQPQGVGSISGPVSMDPPRLGAPWSFRPRAFSQGQPPGSPWNDSGTPSSSGSTLGSSGGIPFPSPGDATPPLSSSTHPGTLASLEQSVQESPRNGGHPAETPGVHQEPAGSPGVQLRANGEGSDAAPSSSSVPLASLGSELQDSEPKNKALQAFLRFQGRLGAGGTSRGPVTESRAQRAPTNGEGHEGLSGLAANFGEENQHPGHQAGAPWDPAAQPMQLPPHQGQCWPQQAHQHQQPFVGPFGGWHQPGRPWGPPIGVPGAAPNAPWYWEGRSMPGPGPPTQAFGPQQRCWPQQGHSQSDHLQEGYTEGTHTRASADGAKPSGRMQALLVCSEVLHVVRPVVYALALRRWGKQSWKPWLASLSLDVASLALLHYHLSRLRTSASLARGLSPQGQGQQMQRHQGPAQGQGPGQRGQRREAGQTKGTKAAPERSQAEAAVLAEVSDAGNLAGSHGLISVWRAHVTCTDPACRGLVMSIMGGLSIMGLRGLVP